MTDAQQMLMSQEGTGPRDEHGRFLPYEDSVGKLTIGYGHLIEKGIPADVANMLFQCDLADAIEDVRHCFSCYDQLSRPRQLVLCSMAYNLAGRSSPSSCASLGRCIWANTMTRRMNSSTARRRSRTPQHGINDSPR